MTHKYIEKFIRNLPAAWGLEGSRVWRAGLDLSSSSDHRGLTSMFKDHLNACTIMSCAEQSGIFSLDICPSSVMLLVWRRLHVLGVHSPWSQSVFVLCSWCILMTQLWPQNLLAQLIAQLWHQASVTRWWRLRHRAPATRWWHSCDTRLLLHGGYTVLTRLLLAEGRKIKVLCSAGVSAPAGQ